MAATLSILASTGPTTAPSFIPVTAIKFTNANTLDITGDVSPSTLDFTFERALRVSIKGTFFQLSNLRLATSNSNPTGTGAIKQYYQFKSSYTQPIEPTATTGYTQLLGSDVSWPNSGVATAATTQWGDFVYLMCTADTIGTGQSYAWNTIFKYDEI